VKSQTFTTNTGSRHQFSAASDMRIMGADEAAAIRLCQEKPSDVEPRDPTDNLSIEPKLATEDPNRRDDRADLASWITPASSFAAAEVSPIRLKIPAE
jgi:hypothetical protein